MHKLGDLLYHPECGLGWIEDIRQTRWAESPLYTLTWFDFEPKTAKNYTHFRIDDVDYFKRTLEYVISGGNLQDW